MTLLLTVAICAGILLDLVAFGANAGILWVVLGHKNLRKAPTSVFLLNLCLSDIFVSLFLIPIAITILFSAFQDEGIYIPTYLCEPVSFINSLLVYSGVWAAAAISVDRRFSIVAPMAHAAFMTTRRALMATAMVWVTAVIFALLPHLSPSESPKQFLNYSTSTSSVSTAMILSLVSSSSSIALHSNSTFNMSASNSTFYLMSYNASTSASVFTESRDECNTWKTCALMFTLDWSNSSHVFAVVIGCYLIPALLMISMYVSIFKVARKAGLQVQKSSTISIPTISGEVEAKAEILEESVVESEQETAAVEAEDSGTGLQGKANRNCIFGHLFWNERKIVADLPYQSSMDTSEEFTCPQCSSRRRLDVTLSDASATKSISAGGKARRTLLLIMGLSLASWTPYYVVHAYCACTNDCWKELSDSKFQCSTTPKPGLTSIPCSVGCSSDMFPVSFLMYRRSYIVSIVVWLMFVSSALNPILYGLLNRPVREQVLIRATSTTAFCSHAVCCCRLCRKTPGEGKQGDEEAGDGVEDFLQFLERTSSLSDTPTTRSSILHNDKT